ncbi:MAG TPA: rod shape-determining protein MreC [bacterium]|nr:rod shape-determining protein MreC [bacterium]
MAIFSKKFRLLHFVLPLILALLFFTFTGSSYRRMPWYEEAFWSLLSPPARIVTGLGSGVRGLWNGYVALVGVQEENESLRKRVAELEGGLMRAQETAAENRRLRDLLAYSDAFPQRTIAATVIANDPRAEFKSITINRGARDGIAPLMPVLGSKGLVGKVGMVSAGSSRIILITDPNSAVDVTVQRSRARGMVVGSAWHTELKAGYYLTRLEYLRSVSDIRDGDVVVTSGLDMVFPPGVPVGSVTDIRLSRYGVFREANVVPFEDTAELREVLVLLSMAEISSKNIGE